MNLSIVLSTQPAQFSALAYKGALAENLGKIQRLGYDGAELAVRDPKLLPGAELDTLLQETRLQVPAIGTGQAFGEEGLSFTHPDAAVRRRAIERIQSHMALATKLGAVVIIGLIRGQVLDAAETAEQFFIEALRECALTAPKVRLVIEPINRYETRLINTVSDGLRFLDRLKLDQVGLLLDTFHMNIEEPSMVQSILTARERIYHFHVADSNRWYPGAGHIPFAEIVDALTRTGYEGFLSAEIMPLPDPDTAAAKTIENMRRICG